MGNSAGVNVGRCAAAVLIAVFASHCRADEGAPERVVLEKDWSKAPLEVPSTLYGIFFEDINWAADGGIYAEMVANRGFDWRTERPAYWEYDFRGGAEARVTQEWAKPLYPENAQYLRIEAIGAGTGCGMRNRGFCGGMKIVGGAKYDLKFYARGVDGYAGGLRVVLEKPSVEKGGAIVQLAEFKVRPGQMKVGEAGATPFDRILPDWTKFTAELVAAEDATNATLSVLLDSKGIVDVEFVSLFPRDTYRHEPNGLRADLVEKLAALRPGIIRFPGGCIAEGDDFMSWYDWKRSVGPVERRYLNENRWDSERSARRLVYWQTQGLGYFEYFRLCEDLGAEPLPICLAGLTCQYRRPTHFAPMESLDYFVTNIVDLIEFATGDPSKNPWAKIRADMGHPAPFRLKYVGIGNENWDQPFFDRYSVVASAVARLHPEITIVSSSGPNVDEGRWERAWKFLREQNAELVDEHYYRDPDWFLRNACRYDSYPRTGPKVYAGEYACHERSRANTLRSAVCEAAMMCGFERNCDVVRMSSYAPLFNNVDAPGYHWTPDMIWFDKSRVLETANYRVQRLFAENRPERTCPLRSVGDASGLFWSAGEAKGGELVVKIVNARETCREVELRLGAPEGEVSVLELSGESHESVNTFEEPDAVCVRASSARASGGSVSLRLRPWSVMVVRIPR